MSARSEKVSTTHTASKYKCTFADDADDLESFEVDGALPLDEALLAAAAAPGLRLVHLVVDELRLHHRQGLDVQAVILHVVVVVLHHQIYKVRM